MSDSSLDRAREAALAEVERSETAAKRFTYLAGALEAGIFVAILFVIDWGDTTHLLIFLCACLAYAPLAVGLIALRTHIDAATQRVLAGLSAVSD